MVGANFKILVACQRKILENIAYFYAHNPIAAQRKQESGLNDAARLRAHPLPASNFELSIRQGILRQFQFLPPVTGK